MPQLRCLSACLSLRIPEFIPTIFHTGFVKGEVAPGTGFPEYLYFLLSIPFYQYLHTRSFIHVTDAYIKLPLDSVLNHYIYVHTYVHSRPKRSLCSKSLLDTTTLKMPGESAQTQWSSAVFIPTTGSLAKRCKFICTNKMAESL